MLFNNFGWLKLNTYNGIKQKVSFDLLCTVADWRETQRTTTLQNAQQWVKKNVCMQFKRYKVKSTNTSLNAAQKQIMAHAKMLQEMKTHA